MTHGGKRESKQDISQQKTLTESRIVSKTGFLKRNLKEEEEDEEKERISCLNNCRVVQAKNEELILRFA